MNKLLILLQDKIFVTTIIFIITLHRKHQRRSRRAPTILCCPPAASLQMTARRRTPEKWIDYWFHPDKSCSLRHQMSISRYKSRSFYKTESHVVFLKVPIKWK